MSRQTSQASDQAAIAEQLENIGMEFGCDRMPGEANELFAARLIDYLDEMISELHGCQDSVRELMAEEGA